jgi:hypothetical protein
MTDDPTSLASAYLDGDLAAADRARVESTPELLAEVDRLRQVRAVLADLPEVSISTRERHLAAALDAWERLPEQERTGALRDATPSGVDAAAVAGAAAVSTPARTSSRRAGRRGRHSSMWLGAAAAGLVIVLAGALVLRSANIDSDDDAPVAESSSDADVDTLDQSSSADTQVPAVAAATIAESELQRASAGETEAAPSENASDVATDAADEAPPSDTGELVELVTPADLADFAAAAVDAPASGDLPEGATVITDAAPADTAADPAATESPLPACLGADVVVGLANYQGQTVVVGLDVGRNLALAYLADGCVRIASASLP